MSYFLLFLTIITLSLTHIQTSSLQGLRALDGSSRSPKTSIEIPIKAQDADYYIHRFNDPTMFYCEKIMGPLGVNDICSLQNSRFTVTKQVMLSNISSPYFLNGDRILSLNDKSINVYGLQNDFERLRNQLITTVNIPTINEANEVFDYSFNIATQQLIGISESKLFILNTGSLSTQKVIDLNPTNKIQFQRKRIFYFQDEYLLVFDKEKLELNVYKIEEDGTLKFEKKVENCQEVYVDTKNVFIFTHDQIKTLSKEEIVVEFAHNILEITNAAHGVLIQTKNKLNDEEVIIFFVELSEGKGFKVIPLFTCPSHVKGVYYTMNNIYLAYENWVRVYPMLKDMQVNGDLYFDFVLNHPVVGVMYTKDRDYLAVSEGHDIALYGNYRSEFALECKKEKSYVIAEYVFQLRYITLNCDTVDFSTQKFANGSCSYTRNVIVYPQEERGPMGTILLVVIGVVIGVAIVVGLSLLKCVDKKTENLQTKTHSPKPKEKKSFNINKGLRRLHHNPSSTNETRKFLHEDESFPSEDMRYSLSASMIQAQKKKQQIFETPRFTSFGGTTTNHHVNYHSVTPAENPNEVEENSKSSGDVDIDITEINEKKSSGSNVGKLKLGDFKNLVRDPTSFRNIGAFMPQSPGKTDNKEEKLEGKYTELQNENGEDDENENEDNANDNNEENNGSVEVHSGSFSN